MVFAQRRSRDFDRLLIPRFCQTVQALSLQFLPTHPQIPAAFAAAPPPSSSSVPKTAESVDVAETALSPPPASNALGKAHPDPPEDLPSSFGCAATIDRIAQETENETQEKANSEILESINSLRYPQPEKIIRTFSPFPPNRGALTIGNAKQTTR